MELVTVVILVAAVLAFVAYLGTWISAMTLSAAEIQPGPPVGEDAGNLEEALTF